MPLWILSALGWLKGLPWQVYAAAGLLALLPISYCQGSSDKNKEWIAKLERAEAEAKEKGEKAREIADANGEENAQEFEAEQETLKELIDEAETSDLNPLDNLFGGLSEAN